MRPRKYPNQNLQKTMDDFMDEVCDYFGGSFVEEDRNEDNPFDTNKYEGHRTIREAAKEFDTSIMRIRKILITRGMFQSETADYIHDRHELYTRKIEDGGKGLSLKDATALIAEELHTSRNNVLSYLPYSRKVYNLEEKSVNAERQKRYRERIKEKKRQSGSV